MSKTWSDPTEVSSSGMTGRRSRDPDLRAFFVDVCARLERTKAEKAIRYQFPSKKEAQRFRTSVVRNMNNAIGKGGIQTMVRDNDAGAYLYVARGKNWRSHVP